MTSIKQLYELQLLDSEIRENQGRLDDIVRRIGESEQILAQREQIAAYKDHLDDLKKKKKDLEWDIEEVSKNIKKLNEKLFSGKVKNPKELLDLEQDVRMHKGNLEQQEDGLLVILTDEEETGKTMAQASERLRQLEKEWQQSQRSLIEERREMEKKLEGLYKQRNGAVGGIESAHLKVYEGIRNRKEPAVCRIEQGRCQGCRLNLPMSQIQGARTGKLVQCTSCGRILYSG